MADKFKVLTLNNISVEGLRHLPREQYEVASEIGHPDAILVRSHNMNDMDIPASVKAIGRAGAGVNNIPVDEMSKRGIPVFNAPGANANAVKELLIAGLFLAARNICQAWEYVRGLEGSETELHKAVEAGKKKFVGFELPGRTLGVVGLGAIGVEVANVALDLGMRVIGFDPKITVERAWQLSSGVDQAVSLDDLCRRSQFLTTHVPLTDGTRNLINAERINLMPDGAIILNFARAGIVEESAVAGALESGKLSAFVTDFPSSPLKSHPRVIALPHLGASTGEAEDNCAVMVAENVRDYLENGNVRRSVNFPDAIMPRTKGRRVTVTNANVPQMVSQITAEVANAGLNIADLLNKSRGDLAYTLVDVEGSVSADLIDRVGSIEGVLNVRVI